MPEEELSLESMAINHYLLPLQRENNNLVLTSCIIDTFAGSGGARYCFWRYLSVVVVVVVASISCLVVVVSSFPHRRPQSRVKPILGGVGGTLGGCSGGTELSLLKCLQSSSLFVPLPFGGRHIRVREVERLFSSFSLF